MTADRRAAFVSAYAQRYGVEEITADRHLREIELKFAADQNEQLARNADQADIEHMTLVGAVTQHFPDGGREWRPDLHGTAFMVEFISWLPDLVRHQAAEKVRSIYLPWVAERIDPFYQSPGHYSLCEVTGQHWHRKSDNALVPEYLLTEA